jgi:(p)ppGpp synthase/HD superfamily hydrolase
MFVGLGLENASNIEIAIALALRAHNGQKRKYSGLPYIVHPFEVASLCINCESFQFDEVAICAAYLHDVIEDCPGHEAYIAGALPIAVHTLVKELTNPSKDSKLPRAKRKEMDREHLSKVSQTAKCIKMIDRTCNLRDFYRAKDKVSPDFLKKYTEESNLLHDVLHTADSELAQQLFIAITDLWPLERT